MPFNTHPNYHKMFKMFRQSPQICLVFSLIFGSMIYAANPAPGPGSIQLDAERKLATLSDGQGDLVLRLNYDGRCTLDQVIVRGREVVGDSGVCTGVRTNGQWFTTHNIATPEVAVDKDTLTVTGIAFGGPGAEIHETWQFTVKLDEIVWRITRKYPADATFEDSAFPEWDFASLSTWTGGLLDDGGVIWNKYLDTTNTTYGGHFGTVTFWNSKTDDSLRIIPELPANQFGAGRFSRQRNGTFSFNYAISGEELKPKHDLNRFLKNRQDLWAPFRVGASDVSAQFTLKALDYAATYDRGTFVGLNGNQVRDLLNTVTRYGVIDAKLTGGNGWRSGYICLHEPFFAEMGLALDQDDYISNFSDCLDYERDHAIGADGRVMSRWLYTAGRGKVGNFNSYGFFETTWGWLLDSQPDYVINVAEQFNLTGDKQWLAGEKTTCEKALDYLLRREVDHSGLVAMTNDYVSQKKSSDWIDVVWAAYENAFVNAGLYEALGLWADDEDALNDPGHAAAYRDFAARLKTTFNRPIADGGFWDPTNQWYVYWRDKDGSIHGNNLVEPVNFEAIAYGICDDDSRRKAILDRMEQEMQKEKLFSWPLCFFSFQPEEGGGGRGAPFPTYENGDIFLSWNELGVRAYANYKPEIALKYVRNILDRYGKDGLSFQRYLRRSQRGAGDDILAGNCMAIVGLYRDIYGIQPQPNRLYLEPHLTPELNGTRLRYELRGRLYWIDLNTQSSAITSGAFTFSDSHPFAVNATDNALEYFPGTNADWAMSISRPDGQPVTVQIENWPDTSDAICQWTETSPPGGSTQYVVKRLQPGTVYELKVNGQSYESLRTDDNGQISFSHVHNDSTLQRFQLAPSS
jgi:hypothetical protein